MKTWVTYLAALLMSFATCLLFGDYTLATDIFSAVSGYLINFSVYLFIPILLITFSSGIASLKKDEAGGRVVSSVIGWSVSTTVILSAAAGIIYHYFPVSFPVTASVGSSLDSLQTAALSKASEALGYLYPANPFRIITEISSFLPPAIILAWVLGLSLKPSADVIRPAYTVINSFSEVMYRISRTITTFGWFLSYTSATWFFLSLYQEKTVLVAPKFLLTILGAVAGAVFIIIPVLYACFTGFRKNPYKVLFRSSANLSLALTTGNIITASIVGESVSRQNLGAQKRITSTAIPCFAVISRGGTAFISTIVTMMLIQGAAGIMPSIPLSIGIACAIMLTSLTSSLFVGYETLFTIYFAMKICGIKLAGAEAAIVALLPLINGLAIFLDSYLSNLGSVVASVYVGTDVEIPYNDTI